MSSRVQSELFSKDPHTCQVVYDFFGFFFFLPLFWRYEPTANNCQAQFEKTSQLDRGFGYFYFSTRDLSCRPILSAESKKKNIIIGCVSWRAHCFELEGDQIDIFIHFLRNTPGYSKCAYVHTLLLVLIIFMCSFIYMCQNAACWFWLVNFEIEFKLLLFCFSTFFSD